MRAALQRVSHAGVAVAGETVAEIGRGILALIGVRREDTERDARRIAERIANLRIFEDEDGKMNLSLLEVGGAALLISNFTLYGDARKGRRPSFTNAAPYAEGEALFESCLQALRELGVPAQQGVYGAQMNVSLTNDGPVTLLVDSEGTFV